MFLIPRLPDLLTQRIALLTRAIGALVLICAFTQCSSSGKKISSSTAVVVSVKDQKLGLYREGSLVKSYKVSTSKFGLGDRPGSNCTPLGRHQIVAKVGHGLPKGAVLKSRRWNGEIVKPDSPGRDPIVSRILWLGGLESANHNAYGRCIYIHGTAEEKKLGIPASYGCIRMAAKDVIDIFDRVGIGSEVMITTNDLPGKVGDTKAQRSSRPERQMEPLPLPKAIPIEIGPSGQMIAKAKPKRGSSATAAVIGPPRPS